MGYLTLTSPLSGKIFFGMVGRAMVGQCTKYEVSRFTRYEAVNGGDQNKKNVINVFTSMYFITAI